MRPKHPSQLALAKQQQLLVGPPPQIAVGAASSRVAAPFPDASIPRLDSSIYFAHTGACLCSYGIRTGGIPTGRIPGGIPIGAIPGGMPIPGGIKPGGGISPGGGMPPMPCINPKKSLGPRAHAHIHKPTNSPPNGRTGGIPIGRMPGGIPIGGIPIGGIPIIPCGMPTMPDCRIISKFLI
eukprot:COSAG05_NODE_1426_length_4919_cov_280.452075_3_plen_181_part_00